MSSPPISVSVPQVSTNSSDTSFYSKYKRWINFGILIITLLTVGYFILQAARLFANQCPVGYKFDEVAKRCVQVCKNSTDIIDEGTGECIPGCDGKKLNPEKHEIINGVCVEKCAKDVERCGTKCLSKGYICINNTICPNSQACETECCGVVDGKPTTCTNGTIMYPSEDSFILSEEGKEITIKIPKNIEGDKPEVFVLNLMNSINKLSKYKYQVTFTDKRFIFTLQSDSTTVTQPKLLFLNTLYPDNLGFTKDKFTFENRQLKSENEVKLYKCMEMPCEEDSVLCGDKCCDKRYCIYGQTCCLPEDNKEICGVGLNMTCCQKNDNGTSNCCGDQCCSKGQSCYTTNGEKSCKIKCDYKSIDGMEIACDPRPKDGQKTGEYCVNLLNKKVSYCGHSDCVFKSINYNPANVEGAGRLGTNAIDVCASNNKLYSKFRNDLAFKLSRIEKSPFDSANSTNCTAEDCISRLNEYGAQNYSIDGNICMTEFDCEKTLASNGDKCPFGEGNRQCCYDKSQVPNFTGQVCKYGLIANYNNTDCDCIKGWGCVDIINPTYNKVFGKKCAIITDPNSKVETSDTQLQCANGGKCKCEEGVYGPNCDQPTDLNKEFPVYPPKIKEYADIIRDFSSIYVIVLCAPGAEVVKTSFHGGQIYDDSKSSLVQYAKANGGFVATEYFWSRDINVYFDVKTKVTGKIRGMHFIFTQTFDRNQTGGANYKIFDNVWNDRKDGKYPGVMCCGTVFD
jgi:hypothetical protein